MSRYWIRLTGVAEAMRRQIVFVSSLEKKRLGEILHSPSGASVVARTEAQEGKN